MSDVGEFEGHQLLFAVSEHRAEGLVRPCETIIRVNESHGQWSFLENFPKSFFVFSQNFIHLFTFSNVTENKLNCRSSLVEDFRCSNYDRDLRPNSCDQAYLIRGGVFPAQPLAYVFLDQASESLCHRLLYRVKGRRYELFVSPTQPFSCSPVNVLQNSVLENPNEVRGILHDCPILLLALTKHLLHSHAFGNVSMRSIYRILSFTFQGFLSLSCSLF